MDYKLSRMAKQEKLTEVYRIRLEPSLLSKGHRIAKEQRRTLAGLIRFLLDRYLNGGNIK